MKIDSNNSQDDFQNEHRAKWRWKSKGKQRPEMPEYSPFRKGQSQKNHRTQKEKNENSK